MPLTDDQRAMFEHAIDELVTYGTGEYRKDLPQALRNVAALADQTGRLTPLHGLVIGAAARRLDEIAGELRPGVGDCGSIQLSARLRQFRHSEGG